MQIINGKTSPKKTTKFDDIKHSTSDRIIDIEDTPEIKIEQKPETD